MSAGTTESAPQVVVHRDADALAAATGDRLAELLIGVQSAGRRPRIVLTGGGSGIGLLAALNASPERDRIDWAQVEIFWGDERFVAASDPERNDLQARDALLSQVGVDPTLVHEMAASDGKFGDDVDAAAAAYAAVIDAGSGGHAGPTFDVVMLGIGPEGHVASIFPDSPAVHEQRLTVVAVRNCPKPPPTRISLTLPTIRAAAQVWIVTAGDGKAEAVAGALSGASEVDLPAAGATGTVATYFLLDTAAASRLRPEQTTIID